MIRQVLPVPLKRIARRYHRTLTLRRAMRRIMRDPVTAIQDASCLRALVYGWGNEGFSAEHEYLAYLVQTVAGLGGSEVLECGSGLSTLLLAATAARFGGRVTSLEHLPSWAMRTRSTLASFGLQRVATVCDAPMRTYGDFSWYDVPESVGPFAAVICDGPPSDTPGGRYGLLPVIGDRLLPGCHILLDDVARHDEQEIMKRWQQQTGASIRVIGIEKPFADVCLPAGKVS